MWWEGYLISCTIVGMSAACLLANQSSSSLISLNEGAPWEHQHQQGQPSSWHVVSLRPIAEEAPTGFIRHRGKQSQSCTHAGDRQPSGPKPGAWFHECLSGNANAKKIPEGQSYTATSSAVVEIDFGCHRSQVSWSIESRHKNRDGNSRRG